MIRITLRDEEFRTVTRLLHDAAGLSFDESRRDSLGFSIAERMAATRTGSVTAYLDLLAGVQGATERQSLLDEVTIPETHFFRNPPQIRALRKFVLPELLRQAAQTRTLRVWSAGCSTGEEAYTIAILIRELVSPTADWDIKIVATDISTKALAAARAAKYAERAFVMADPLDLGRWFVGGVGGGSVVRDEVRELVEFRHHNLVTDEPPFEPGEADLILCRNVTIYFDRETTRRLMKRLHTRLRDGGYLFLGHAETLWQISDDFTLVPLGDAFVYRRLDADRQGDQRRRVLPDRRTDDDLRPTRADRRRDLERRGQPVLARQVPILPRLSSPAQPVAAAAAQSASVVPVARDPLDAVRSALSEGRYDEAADIAGEVITATPLLSQAHYLHGVALTSLGRDTEALVVLRKTVYLDPDHGYAHFLLGGALDRLGEPTAASRSYRAAATTLGRRTMDNVAPELGGRSVAELATLCMQLAQRADRNARSTGGRP